MKTANAADAIITPTASLLRSHPFGIIRRNYNRFFPFDS